MNAAVLPPHVDVVVASARRARQSREPPAHYEAQCLERGRERMADWGPVVIAVVLFVLLSPGLVFQLPGKERVVECRNFQTSWISILVHAIIYFAIITIILIAIGVHIYTG